MSINLFHLDQGSGVPFYRQIIDQVLLAVADGRLRAGMQLPTVRQLAVDLAVNLNTVAKAYREMEIRGIVTTQQGTGTFVAARQTDSHPVERRRAVEQIVERSIASAAAMGISIAEVVDALVARAGLTNKEDVT